jgi:hypothetical protein
VKIKPEFFLKKIQNRYPVISIYPIEYAGYGYHEKLSTISAYCCTRLVPRMALEA